MAKLVIEIQDSDNDTYWCTITHALNYFSKDEFARDLGRIIKERFDLRKERDRAILLLRDRSTFELGKAIFEENDNFEEANKSSFILGGLELEYYQFLKNGKFVPPKVYTLDEWFNKEAPKEED